MKSLFIALFLFSSISTNMFQETEKMNATFDGYEDGIYYFTDEDGYSNQFHGISEEAEKAYDLTTDEFKGKVFQVTYMAETDLDEEDEEITVNTIVALKLYE